MDGTLANQNDHFSRIIFQNFTLYSFQAIVGAVDINII